MAVKTLDEVSKDTAENMQAVEAPAPIATTEAAPVSALTPEIQALLAAMGAQQSAQLIAAVQEMKKPSDEEQAKIDDERTRRTATALRAAQEARTNEQTLRDRQKRCAHSKPNGMTAFIGQVNSDGCVRYYCVQCKYESKPVRVPDWQRAEGLNLHKIPAASLTIAKIEAMAAASEAPLHIPTIPIGMEADLS